MSCLKWYKSEETPPPPPSQRVLIIDMPDLVMRKILEEVDLVSIMKLRKVCRAFRNYIDDTKPDSKLFGITIYVRSDTIIVSYWYFLSKPLREKTPSKEVTVFYKNNKNGCDIRFGQGQLKHVNGRNAFDVFCEDMQTVLGNQKTTISQFYFYDHKNVTSNEDESNSEDESNNEDESNSEESRSLNIFQKSLELVFCRRRLGNKKTFVSQNTSSIAMYNQAFDFYLKILKSRKHPLQVRYLNISINGQDQLETLLERVDPRELKRLAINEERYDIHPTVKGELNLDILKNFGNLKHLLVLDFLITSSLESLSHILSIKGTFKKITATEILARKETHLKSWYCDYVIKYDEFTDKSRLSEMFGTPSHQTAWKFDIPNSEKNLGVFLWLSRSVMFTM
ncbi:hypothetical protein CRE_23335 [Caenorhabditis remanei]|uniref:F-box domain-containing protein n=1 Tax=Caenorhabditis remanei TaxID=31234 RepID=E3MGX9_CAERE|nr:hypothetical protein CRE_23335 [Caenorhabditis remanei]